MSAVQLPTWRCHKVVQAARIEAIVRGDDPDDITLCVACPPHMLKVNAVWDAKHVPQPGGYFVRYEDGYESYSPAKAFEEGYTRIATDDHPRPTPRFFESLAPGYGGEP